MLIILFGLPGAGKTHIGKLLQQKFGFCFLEGDYALTQDMQDCIANKQPFTQPMRNNFTKILINRINLIKQINGNTTKIVMSQALFKQKNRGQIRQMFPEAIFVHVTADTNLLRQRLLNRGDEITPEYFERLQFHFDAPTPDEGYTVELINSETNELKTIEKCIIAIPGLKTLDVIQENTKTIDLAGKKVVITAGPTREYIDPVRYLTNESSGKMGYEIAKAFTTLNANVILISGPTQLSKPNSLNKFINVTSAKDMHQAVMHEITDADIFIGVAAVADYSPVNPEKHKIKKGSDTLEIVLKRNPDILSGVADYAHDNKKPMMIVGFAAETNNLYDYALGKLISKNADMICANQVGENLTFGADTNQITIFKRNNEIIKIPLKSKEAIAQELAQIIGSDYICLTKPTPPIYQGLKPEPNLLLRGKTKEISNYYLSLEFFKNLPDCSYQDIHIKTIDENSHILLRLFKQANSKNVPTILYLPGTGFSRMIHAVEYDIAKKIFDQTKCNVLLINYRLAPENKYPKAILDGYRALEYLIEQANELKIDKNKIILLGYSSGATLAIQLAVIAHANGYSIAQQILLSPITDFTFKHGDYLEYENKDRYIKPEFVKALCANYLLENIPLNAANISPYYQTFDNLPPTIILAGVNDRHRSDIEAFAEKLMLSDRKIEKFILDESDHCSFWDNALPMQKLCSSIKSRFELNQPELVQPLLKFGVFNTEITHSENKQNPATEEINDQHTISTFGK